VENKSKKLAPPHGWGAPEILRAMHEDQRRYRRPTEPPDARKCGVCGHVKSATLAQEKSP
jgi:hypothetical protein